MVDRVVGCINVYSRLLKPKGIRTHECSSHGVVYAGSHVVEPTAIARDPMLTNERERVGCSARTREQTAEGKVAVAGDDSAGRVGQADRRAQSVEVVVVRAAGRDLARQT